MTEAPKLLKEVTGPKFKCAGLGFVGASWDGSIAIVEIMDVDGKRLNLCIPPGPADMLAERLKAAAQQARDAAKANGLKS